MDINAYKNKIKQQLLSSQMNTAHIMDAQSIGLSPVPKPKPRAQPKLMKQVSQADYDDLVRKMNKFGGPVIDFQSTKPSAVIEGGSIEVPMKQGRKKATPINLETNDTPESNEYHGGKFHFLKSVKKMGSEIGHGVKTVVVGQATKELGTAIYSGLKSGAKSLVADAPEELAVGEEVAPMAMLAAGMKKPRKKRVVSDRERNRHALIKQLMQKHNCTLAEASSHIKKHNLEY